MKERVRRAKIGLWMLLLLKSASCCAFYISIPELLSYNFLVLLLESRTQSCPRPTCPWDQGCRLVSDGRSCPRCKCDLGYYRRPAHVDEFVCPPIKSCPKEYGCEIRQRIGKCPFCKCYFKKHRRNVPF
ncbi:hypothetical protein ISCGN_029234 [Ixodes scapularis]